MVKPVRLVLGPARSMRTNRFSKRRPLTKKWPQMRGHFHLPERQNVSALARQSPPVSSVGSMSISMGDLAGTILSWLMKVSEQDVIVSRADSFHNFSFRIIKSIEL
jgi:hypothetical protein